MVASDFGTAIYTNCAPGEGLDGVGGMQFQSRSPGVDRETLAVIRRHLIYEPPERLIQEQQPIDAYPPSFAHVSGGLFATAAGLYIGREAGGARQGNHLTHAIVTSDPRAYRSVRPAQMFRAAFWRTEPAASTESEPLGASWEPGPLDAGQASQFVRDQPDGVPMLAAILTAMLGHVRSERDRDPRRVLFISERFESVMLWLTAATLLLPQQEAVRIGFKVFTTDPARTVVPVVAVHPDWARSAATVEQDRGYVVFDLVRHLWTAVPESPGAQHWARLFGEADPYAVSEAVELAAASGLRGSAARDLATAAVLHQAPSAENAGQLARWLRSGPPALREAYGGTLTSILIRTQDLYLLRELDISTQEQFPGRRDQVRLVLLRLELDSALRNPVMSQPDEPPRAVSAAIQAEAVRLVTEALRQAHGAAFDAVLCVSRRFGISVPLGAVSEATAAFVAFWADHPGATFDPSAWPAEPPVYEMLRDELAVRIQDRPDIADAWWNQLWRWTPEQPDISLPLERELLSAAMANGNSQVRLRIVRNVLGQRPNPAAPVPYRALADQLWSRTRPTIGELREVCRLVPAGTALDMAIYADVLASAESDPPGLQALDLCGMLEEHGMLKLGAASARLLAQHRWLDEYEARLGSAGEPADADDQLRHIPRKLLTAHAERLGRALLKISDPMRSARLLDTLPQPVVVAYLQALRDDQRLFSPGRVAVIVAACRRLGARPPDGNLPSMLDPRDQVCHDLDWAVIDWRQRASKADDREVVAYLSSFGGELVTAWRNYEIDAGWSRWLRRMPGRRWLRRRKERLRRCQTLPFSCSAWPGWC